MAAAASRGANPGMPTLPTPGPLGVALPSPLLTPGAAQAVTTPSAAQTNPNVHVSVGNAALQAHQSKLPPKFACVLLIGPPSVGKTTVGRQMVQQLNEDKIPWAFFSGSDYIRNAPTKPTPWETMREVFDALSTFIDGQLAKQATSPIRGLVIDKQCRGVEEVYYLSGLLKSRGLTFSGIIALDVSDDNVLLDRMGGSSEAAREKIKFHRVAQSRIMDVAKQAGLWQSVDASGPKEALAQALRTKALGCSSQRPLKQISPSSYSDINATLVDNYTVYAQVLTTLSTLVKTNKPGQFAGFTGYTNLPLALLDEKHPSPNRAQNSPLREYLVRRKADGIKFVLLFDGADLYLIPRHMRCCFLVSQDAWLGASLQQSGKFVMDGDLVRLHKERNSRKEKFLVYDMLFLADRGSTANMVAHSTWRDRQERLKVALCSESSGFFSKKGDMIIVLQSVHEMGALPQLLEPCDYPSDGIVFQSQRREDPTYLWRPPELLTADFRLGSLTASTENTKTFVLEAFDTRSAKYVPFHNDVVEVSGTRATAVEGAICSCALELTPDPNHIGGDLAGHRWSFQRVRNDLNIAMAKNQVEELIQECVVPRSKLLAWCSADSSRQALPVAAPAVPHVTAPLGVKAPPMAINIGGSSSYGVATRTTFGSALGRVDPPAAVPQPHPVPPAPTSVQIVPLGSPPAQPSDTDIDKLRRVVRGTVKAVAEGSAAMSAADAAAKLESMLRQANVRRVEGEPTSAWGEGRPHFMRSPHPQETDNRRKDREDDRPARGDDRRPHRRTPPPETHSDPYYSRRDRDRDRGRGERDRGTRNPKNSSTAKPQRGGDAPQPQQAPEKKEVDKDTNVENKEKKGNSPAQPQQEVRAEGPKEVHQPEAPAAPAQPQPQQPEKPHESPATTPAA